MTPDPVESLFSNVKEMSGWDASQLLGKSRKPVDTLKVKGLLNLYGGRKPVRLPRALSATGLVLTSCSETLTLPEILIVKKLTITGCPKIESLPNGLHVRELKLESLSVSALPEDLIVERRLHVTACPRIDRLPPGVRKLEELVFRDNPEIRELPENLEVEHRLDLSGCSNLERIPDSVRKVPILNLRGCSGLVRLPENLEVNFLDLSNCLNLESLPANGSIRYGRLDLANCLRIREIPAWVNHIAQLNVSGCANLFKLPPDLVVSSWIDVGGSGLTELPEGCRGVQLRWRGVRIDERIAFQPETITAAEVLAERNVELRRVKLERLGYEKFFEETEAKVLDTDSDPGGERKLLSVEIENDETLVCVSVNCPSTSRNYLIRVPPTLQTCRAAVAWIAGFDNPDEYHPVIET